MNIIISLTKYNTNSSLSWNKLWSGLWADTGQSLILSVNGVYVVTRRTNSYGMGSDDALLMKMTLAV